MKLQSCAFRTLTKKLDNDDFITKFKLELGEENVVHIKGLPKQERKQFIITAREALEPSQKLVVSEVAFNSYEALYTLIEQNSGLVMPEALPLDNRAVAALKPESIVVTHKVLSVHTPVAVKALFKEVLDFGGEDISIPADRLDKIAAKYGTSRHSGKKLNRVPLTTEVFYVNMVWSK